MTIAVATLTVGGVVMFYYGRAINGRPCRWPTLLAFQTLFALMTSRPWLYIWDYFILLVGAIFLLLVIRLASQWAFPLVMSRPFFGH
jgi:hypothetical protein